MVELLDLEDNHHLCICNVYGPVLYYKKNKKNWNYLGDLREKNLHARSIVEGYFNTTISQSKRRGGARVRDPFGEQLEELQSHSDLVDVKPRKGI